MQATYHTEAPIIVVGNASVKSSPSRLKDVELAEQKVFNRRWATNLFGISVVINMFNV